MNIAVVVPDDTPAVACVETKRLPLRLRIDTSLPDPDILKNNRVDWKSLLVSVSKTAPTAPVPFTVNELVTTNPFVILADPITCNLFIPSSAVDPIVKLPPL